MQHLTCGFDYHLFRSFCRLTYSSSMDTFSPFSTTALVYIVCIDTSIYIVEYKLIMEIVHGPYTDCQENQITKYFFLNCDKLA